MYSVDVFTGETLRKCQSCHRLKWHAKGARYCSECEGEDDEQDDQEAMGEGAEEWGV